MQCTAYIWSVWCVVACVRPSFFDAECTACMLCIWSVGLLVCVAACVCVCYHQFIIILDDASLHQSPTFLSV